MITVEFKDFDDMVAFAKRVAGGNGDAEPTKKHTQVTLAPVQQPAPAVAAVSTPIQQPAPTVTVVSAPVQQPVPVSTQQAVAVPTSVQSYTLDDLARAAMTLMDSGRQGELLTMLQNFGVEALPALPKEQYGAFATALRGLGAQI